MRLPIDTSAIKFAAAGPAEPVLDFATKAPRTDENGVPLYSVPVFAAGSGVKDSITIKVVGEGQGPLRVHPGKDHRSAGPDLGGWRQPWGQLPGRAHRGAQAGCQLMLTKVILVLVVIALAQFLILWTLTHLGIVLLGAAGWWIWSQKVIRSNG